MEAARFIPFLAITGPELVGYRWGALARSFRTRRQRRPAARMPHG